MKNNKDKEIMISIIFYDGRIYDLQRGDKQ